MMVNPALYKHGLRSSIKILLIFAAVLALYFVMVIPMFDPALGAALEEMARAMPEMMRLFGMEGAASTLLEFLAGYLYGFLMPCFPMVFTILCANKLFARHEDKGSMAYLLSAPVTRQRIALSQISALVTGVSLLIASTAVLGWIGCEVVFPGQLDIGRYFLLNIGTLCLHLFIAGVCVLCCCAFSDPKQALGAGAGIPILAFIIQMLANAGDSLEAAKYLTFFTLFNPDALAAGVSGGVWGMAVLIIGAVMLFTLSVWLFRRKDMHV